MPKPETTPYVSTLASMSDKFEKLRADIIVQLDQVAALHAEIHSLREHAEAMAKAIAPVAMANEMLYGDRMDAGRALDAYRKEYPNAE